MWASGLTRFALESIIWDLGHTQKRQMSVLVHCFSSQITNDKLVYIIEKVFFWS